MALPEVPEEVKLPEDLSHFVEPTFTLVLATVAGHKFLVREPIARAPSSQSDAADDPEDSRPTKEFDPVATLLEKAKSAEDPLTKRVVLFEREELQQLAGEDKAIWAGLKVRVEREREVRTRIKSNAARRRAIAAHEAAKAAQAAGEPAPEEALSEAAVQAEAVQADVVVLLRDLPGTAEEFQELSKEGLCSSGIVDLWTLIYFAGETVQVPSEGPAQVAPCAPPSAVTLLHQEIQAAGAGSDLANCTVSTLKDSHALAFSASAPPSPEGSTSAPATDEGPTQRVEGAVLRLLGEQAQAKHHFRKWLSNAKPLSIPDISEDQEKEARFKDDRLYKRLIGSVDAAHYDVPLFLHCLAEQVQQTLEGESHHKENERMLHSLEDFFNSALNGASAENGLLQKPTGLKAPPSPEEAAGYTGQLDGGRPLLSSLDGAATRHLLGGGAKIGDKPVADAVHEVLQEVPVAGSRRLGMPRVATFSSVEREALQSRLYPFAPKVPALELEQMVLLHSFETLLTKAQPDRQWLFLDRHFRERIPNHLLSQVFQAALQTEPMIDTAYLPRYDCLLVALHHRSLPGRVTWHSWKGDLLHEANSEHWSNGLVTAPTFSDWREVIWNRRLPGNSLLQPQNIVNVDSRDLGYGTIVEKLAIPADGSLLLVTRMESGLRESFPPPSNDTGTISAIAAEEVTHSFDIAGRNIQRKGRVMKSGLTYGIVRDAAWVEPPPKALEVSAEEQEETRAAEGEEQEEGEKEEQEVDAPEAGAPHVPGSFWLAFPNGSRCTARIHHERASPEGLSAGPKGVLFGYTTASGEVVKVFSDASIQLLRSLPLSSSSTPSGSGKASQRRFHPGCAEDLEVSRTILPLGTVARRLLSGRREVFHPDGTTAFRNPTFMELQQALKVLQATLGGAPPDCLDLLQRLLKDAAPEAELSAPPTSAAKAAGMPGHWVVVRSDGRCFGRAPAPPAEETAPVEEEAPQAEEGQESEEPVLPPRLEELLSGVLVEDGSIIEYDVQEVAMAQQVDLLSKHRVLTTARGVASFEDPEGFEKVTIHADGTRIASSRAGEGVVIEEHKEGLSSVRFEVGQTQLTIIVECSDGARLEVVPSQVGPAGQMVALNPHIQDLFTEVSHASVALQRHDGHKVSSVGDGTVLILPASRAAEPVPGTHKALCHEGRILVSDALGGEFELLWDQTILTRPAEGFIQPPSPRCAAAGKAYGAPNLSGTAPPADYLEPRLFLVYGNGEAEELLRAAEANAVLEAAEANSAVFMVRDQALEPQMPGCKSHTIFQWRQPESTPVPSTGGLAVPQGAGQGKEPEGSNCTALTQASQRANVQAEHHSLLLQSGAITEYRQILEFPVVTEDARQRLGGTLQQYRQWEAEQLAALRALAEKDSKKGKDKKGKKEAEKKPEKKDEKKKKGKRGSIPEEATPEAEAPPPIPVFEEGLQLTPFQHVAQALKLRATIQAPVETSELLKQALTARDAAQEPEEEVAEPNEDLEALQEEVEPVAEAEEEKVEVQVPEDIPEENLAQAREEMLRKLAEQQLLETEYNFAFWKSEMGLQFLIETGAFDPDAKNMQRPATRERKPPVKTRRSPWNPRLVGEVDQEDEEQEAAGDEANCEDDAEEAAEDEGWAPGDAEFGRGGDRTAQEMNFAPNTRLPIVPEKEDVPAGPHPDKKAPFWDIYGEPRRQKGPMSQAFVQINTDYLQVEGATDRRVRTSSIAHKKNAAKAPSVSSIRHQGQHLAGLTSDQSALDILGEAGVTNPEDHWRVSSTMQGLGDSNQLVEVVPGACRFGPLRLGSVYRMAFYLRNLDVDVTRFNITPVQSQFVRVIYQPGHLAPGIATKIVVEVLAKCPAKIEQLVEIKVKAHVIRVPVMGRVYDAEEYDRLDAESLALHGRRIGRHRERSEQNKPGPVSLVTDEAYCKKVLGEAFKLAPADFDEAPPRGMY